MQKRTIIIAAIIFLLLLVATYIVLSNKNPVDVIKNKFLQTSEDKCDDCSPTTNTQDFSDSSGGSEITNTGSSSVGAGGGSAGTSEGSGTSESETEEENLPSDVNAQPCGFYSGEYGTEACGGYCPKGTCVAEGRSCYCKE